ncbi:hypothetical protein D3C78_1366930 [compost metagenome]
MLQVDLSKQRQFREGFAKLLHSLLALAAAFVVFGIHKAAAFVRITNYQLVAPRLERHEIIFQRIAHKQNSMVLLAVCDCELIHDAAFYAIEFVLGFLRQKCNLHCICRQPFKRQECISGNNLNGCRGR